MKVFCCCHSCSHSAPFVHAQEAAVSLQLHSLTQPANYFRFHGLHVLKLKEKPNFQCLATVANIPCDLACRLLTMLWFYQLAHELKLAVYSLLSRHSAALTGNFFLVHGMILKFVFFVPEMSLIDSQQHVYNLA